MLGKFSPPPLIFIAYMILDENLALIGSAGL